MTESCGCHRCAEHIVHVTRVSFSFSLTLEQLLLVYATLDRDVPIPFFPPDTGSDTCAVGIGRYGVLI